MPQCKQQGFILSSDLTKNAVDELQTIHAFVTLMCWKDPGARKWVALLVNELNEIMYGLSEQTSSIQVTLGKNYGKSLFR